MNTCRILEIRVFPFGSCSKVVRKGELEIKEEEKRLEKAYRI